MKKSGCPSCKKEILWTEDFPFRPFCSERCRLLDLGNWASDSYSIPIPDSPPNESDEDLPPFNS